MSSTSWFLLSVGLVVAALLCTGAWVDHQARRRGGRPMSSAEVARAVKDAKREARASRGRLHIGGGQGRRSPSAPVPRPWDDRRR